MNDKKIQKAIEGGAERQLYNIELIVSEDYMSRDVPGVIGSILTNRYVGDYPSKRYYGGYAHANEIEEITRKRAKQLPNTGHTNMQLHSGSQANMGVYLSVSQPGDTVLGMNLTAGGHLTHGHPLDFSGTLYRFVDYGVTRGSRTIDYEEVHRVALKEQPKLTVADANVHPRVIDFAKFREIADEVSVYFIVDMVHIAGLIAAGEHPSPVPYADFMITTTYKALRGPHGGLILYKEEHVALLNEKVLPSMQSGSLMYIIATKTVCLQEAMQSEFREYIKQVTVNCAVMSNTLEEEGFRITSDGTDNHLILIDVKSSLNMGGKPMEKLLDEAGITYNKNAIPFEIEKPFVISGIRLGTTAMTAKGLKENGFRQVALWISRAPRNTEDEAVREEVCKEMCTLTVQFPLLNEK